MNPQLNLFTPASNAAPDENVRWLESYLNERPGWHTATEIAAALRGSAGVPASTEDLKRKIRDLASQSSWIISGQKGYQHLARSTAEEINHFCNWMESQAGQMQRRAETIRKNAHRIFG